MAKGSALTLDPERRTGTAGRTGAGPPSDEPELARPFRRGFFGRQNQSDAGIAHRRREIGDHG